MGVGCRRHHEVLRFGVVHRLGSVEGSLWDLLDSATDPLLGLTAVALHASGVALANRAEEASGDVASQ